MARRQARASARRASTRPRAFAPALAGPRAVVHRGDGSTSERTVTVDEPAALVFTHWFDSSEAGERHSTTIRFTGRRIGIHGHPRPSDTFAQDETIENIVPGTGPVSITTWVYGLVPGEWNVTGELVRSARRAEDFMSPAHRKPVGAAAVHRAAWSWRRWSIRTVDATPMMTRWALLAPLARQPAVIPGIYTALAVLGAVVALALQSAILGRRDVPVGPILGATVLGLACGLIGAKLWYAVLHPDESILRGGWAVDGFLVVAPLVAAVTLFAFDLPIGTALDAVTPGLFFAVAIGRIGCFLTGCCAGRATASRWALWSSDRRIGTRRRPIQLVESGVGLGIGLVALLLVIGDASPVPGAIFVGAFAVYAVVRQFLLRLRAEQRKSRRSLHVTALAAVLVLLFVAVLSLAQGT